MHEWNTARSISASLPAAPGTLFNIEGTPAARNAARMVGSLKLAQAASVAFYANVVADLSARGQSVGGNIGFKGTW